MNEGERAALIERLDLDPDLLAEVAHRTHQWGDAIANLLNPDRTDEAAAQEQRLPAPEVLRSEAASLYAIAGSYRMLLGPPGLARKSMLPAAQHLAANRSTFSYPLAICAREPAILFETLGDLSPEMAAHDRANVLLASSWIEVSREARELGEVSASRELFQSHLNRARPAAEASVGRMRIPLGTLAHTLDAANRVSYEEENPQRLNAILREALLRMHEATAAAMRDRYHWQNLMSSVLPVEPEAVVLAGVAMAATMRGGFELHPPQDDDLPSPVLASLRLGYELAMEAW